jgi:hypothetical protein
MTLTALAPGRITTPSSSASLPSYKGAWPINTRLHIKKKGTHELALSWHPPPHALAPGASDELIDEVAARRPAPTSAQSALSASTASAHEGGGSRAHIDAWRRAASAWETQQSVSPRASGVPAAPAATEAGAAWVGSVPAGGGLAEPKLFVTVIVEGREDCRLDQRAAAATAAQRTSRTKPRWTTVTFDSGPERGRQRRRYVRRREGMGILGCMGGRHRRCGRRGRVCRR